MPALPRRTSRALTQKGDTRQRERELSFLVEDTIIPVENPKGATKKEW